MGSAPNKAIHLQGRYAVSREQLACLAAWFGFDASLSEKMNAISARKFAPIKARNRVGSMLGDKIFVIDSFGNGERRIYVWIIQTCLIGYKCL